MGQNWSRYWLPLVSALVAVLMGCVGTPVWAQEEPPPPEPEQITPEGGEAAPAPEPPAAEPAPEKAKAPPRQGLPVAKGPVSLTKVKDPKTGKMVVKITNDDLDRIYGKSVVPRASAIQTPGVAPSSATGGGSPSPGAAPDPAAKIKEISQDLERQKKLLSTMTNPFQSRPKLTEEEKAERKGKGASEIYRETQEKIEGLEDDLEKWRDKQAEPTEDSSQK